MTSSNSPGLKALPGGPLSGLGALYTDVAGPTLIFFYVLLQLLVFLNSSQYSFVFYYIIIIISSIICHI